VGVAHFSCLCKSLFFLVEEFAYKVLSVVVEFNLFSIMGATPERFKVLTTGAWGPSGPWWARCPWGSIGSRGRGGEWAPLGPRSGAPGRPAASGRTAAARQYRQVPSNLQRILNHDRCVRLPMGCRLQLIFLSRGALWQEIHCKSLCFL